jgi:hypothetical protein
MSNLKEVFLPEALPKAGGYEFCVEHL